MAGTAQAEGDGHLARNNAADADGNCVWRDVAAACGEKVLVLTFPYVDPAATGADDDARTRFACTQRGIRPCLAGGDDAEQRSAGIPFRIRPPAFLIVAVQRDGVVDRHRWHRGRNLTRPFGDVELRDAADPAAAVADVMPVALAPDAERRDDTDARDDDAGLGDCPH